jgi:hypothetical protein
VDTSSISVLKRYGTALRMSGIVAALTAGTNGCSSSSGTEMPSPTGTKKPAATSTETAADGCDAIVLAPPAAGAGVQISIDLPLEAGQERQVCRLVMPGLAVNMNWADGIYTKGSHHGLTARTTYRDALPTQNIRGEAVQDASQIADCETVGSNWDVQGILAGGHTAGESSQTELNAKGTLPDDVALKVAANEVLELNFHMFNTSDHPIHACYKQNLYGIRDDQVRTEAGIMFYYNSFITVPANGRASTTMACPVVHDVTLAEQVSHMHKRGVGYTALLLDGDPLAGGQEVQKLYEGTDWLEPVVKVNSPALPLSRGQWIQWSCDYENPENRNVAQGQQTTDEMCMFIGTYWPRSPEMDGCRPEGSMNNYKSSRLLANGTKNGAEFLDCWNNSPKVVGGGGPESSADRYTTQRCFTDSCAQVSGRINEFGSSLDPSSIPCD